MGEEDRILSKFSEKEELEWIQTCEQISAINNGEGVREKMTAKIKENPFVPVGMLATSVALSYGIYSMRTGNKRKSQQMMRARILAQGFTVAAILIGVLVAAKSKPTKL